MRGCICEVLRIEDAIILLDVAPPGHYCSARNKRRRAPTRRPAAPPAEGAIVFSLLGAAHALEARLEAAVDKVGLSLAKAGVLKCLADAREPVALSDMAQRLQCVRSNMTQLGDRLEQDGLVRRRADSAGRRRGRGGWAAGGGGAPCAGPAGAGWGRPGDV